MATAPTSPVGKLMVVSGGATMAAIGTSSKPTTLMSRGTEIPRAVNPAMTPSAIWSLNASTAETPLATMSGTTIAVASNVGSPTVSSTTSIPLDRPVRRTAVRRSPAAHDPFGPTEIGQPCVPEPGQMHAGRR